MKPHRKTMSFMGYVVQGLLLEMKAWRVLVRNEWPLVVMFVVGLVILVNQVKPFPPSEISILVGQQGSSYEALANRFADYFKEHGIKLNALYTEGTQDNLKSLIAQPNINIALTLAGSTEKGAYPELMTLGSVQYEPLWLFYTGPVYKGDDPFAHFSAGRVAIGAPGSGTQHLLREMLKLRGITLEQQKNFREFSHRQAAQALLDGELDAMVIVDGFTSPTIQHLLAAEGVHIYSFALAPAYIKQLPYLDVVTIPRGSLNLEQIYPPEDVKMVSSSLTLLIDQGLHPALQLLFLMAADKFGDARDQFFARPDEFPAYKDQALPLSPVAKQYFDEGPPVSLRYVPFWAASFLNRMWLLVLGVVAVGYPLFRLTPNYRHTNSRIQIASAYEDVRKLEQAARTATRQDQIDHIMSELTNLETEIDEIPVPTDTMSHYYSLWSALNIVQKYTKDRSETLSGS